MEMILHGKATVIGNNIDTDQIYPGRYLELTDPKEIGSHCLCGLDENISKNFPQNGFIIAGKNFGCGSSREHAPIALINMGVSAIIADSFARIFYRNAINLGLPVIICEGISQKINNGDLLTLNLKENTVRIENKDLTLYVEPLGEQASKILAAGGIKPLMRKKLQDK